MNLILPVCPIPEELGWVLKSHFHNNRKSYAKISDEIYQSPFLRLLVPKLFAPYMKNQNIESMLNALGWNGFRDRLTSIYLYKMEHGQFPTAIDEHLLEEVKKFESTYDEYSFEGNSRIFMLGVYLKMGQMKLKAEHQFMNDSLLELRPVVKKLLKLGTQKTTKGDWLILTLILLSNLVDDDLLLETAQKNHGNFYKCFSLLDEKKKELLIMNLLAYGASINDDEIFIYDKV